MRLFGNSIFFRFFWSVLLIFLLLIPVALFLIFRDIEGFYKSQLIKHLESLTRSLSGQLTPLLTNKPTSPEAIDRFAKLYGRRLGIRITVIDPTGKVLGDSEEDPQKMENHAGRPEVRQAMKTGHGSSFRFSTTVEHTLLYYAIRLDDGGNPLGILRVSLFADQIRPVLNRLKHRMLITGSLIILLASLFALIYGRSFHSPIKSVAKALEKLASGNFSVRLPSDMPGEVSIIARHVNETAQRLEALFRELAAEREGLKSIVESLNVGIMVIELEGRILMVNKSFHRTGLVQNGDCEGKYYWECFREGRINEFILEVRQKLVEATREISSQGRTYLVTVTPIPRRNKIIIAFHDISKLKETERIKRDLVANISHEIKTPLTAIRGYVETLLEEEQDDMKRKHLSVVYRHVNRLSRIAEDLITLHALDMKEPFQEVPVNLGELVNRVTELYIAQAQKKGLTLSVNVASELQIMADPLKMEELLINLIDNAVRYTREGEVKISVCEADDGEAVISISDTGIGIPAEHIPRIFERFYVVDKSRSRESGGTGLGLAIVKHIVERLGGTISVESKPGKGSTFTVRLPASGYIAKSERVYI